MRLPGNIIGRYSTILFRNIFLPVKQGEEKGRSHRTPISNRQVPTPIWNQFAPDTRFTRYETDEDNLYGEYNPGIFTDLTLFYLEFLFLILQKNPISNLQPDNIYRYA
jgi:hypothetical protein